jgi:hypothetical protein
MTCIYKIASGILDLVDCGRWAGSGSVRPKLLRFNSFCVSVFQFRREIRNGRATCGIFGHWALVGRQIIPDDDIALFRGSARAFLDIGLEDAPVHWPLTRKGAVSLSTGAFERRRRPLKQRPRRRVISVVVPVSSRKMNRCGSSRSRGWRLVVRSSRALLMSGRSCSLAKQSIFLAIAVADETAHD